MNTDEQPDDEVPRARSGGVPSAAAPAPVELGGTTLPHVHGSPTPKLSECHPVGAYLEASGGVTDRQFHFRPLPGPSPETWGLGAGVGVPGF